MDLAAYEAGMTRPKQKYRWSCLSACFAFIFNISEDDLHKFVGHDGSEIMWPEYEEPMNRRAFHPQEMIDFAMSNGFGVTWIDASPGFEQGGKPVYITTKPDRMKEYLKNHSGVLTGVAPSGKRHAVVWNKHLGYIQDPNGTQYPLEAFKVENFFIIGGD